MYRSVNFFSYCSYDLAQLTFVPWDELYYRQPKDTNKLIQIVYKVLDNAITYHIPEVREHILTELVTEKKFRHKLNQCCCVFDKKEEGVVGYLTIVSAREITTNLNVIH